jgi:hypothetical protein
VRNFWALVLLELEGVAHRVQPRDLVVVLHGRAWRPVLEQSSQLCGRLPPVTGTGVPTRHEVPQSAWVLGWACLAGQVASLVERGATDGDSALFSVPLSALVVAWVSHGVLRARMIRVWSPGSSCC